MDGFFNTYGTEILCAVLIAGILWLFRQMYKKMGALKEVLDEQQNREMERFVEKRLEPIYEELEDLRKYVRETKAKDDKNLAFIIASYRFRLIQLCREHLKAGFMTQMEYDQLTEFYKLYTSLGGNGQAKEYYERTIQLPIRED